MTDPLTIALIGTLIVIASVLVTGPYISSLESQISNAEASILDYDRQIEGAAQAIQRSYQHYFPAEIKLAILNTNPKTINRAGILAESFKSFVQGILERYVAVTGEGPSQERFREIEKIALRAANGDQFSANELSTLSAGLISDWAQRHKNLVENRNTKKSEVASLKRKVEFWRNVAISLQVIGLIAVLFKDVVNAGSS